MIKDILEEFKKKYLELYPDDSFNDYQYYKLIEIVEQSIIKGLYENSKKNKKKELIDNLVHDCYEDLSLINFHNNKFSDFLSKNPKIGTYPYVYNEYMKSRFVNMLKNIENFYIESKKYN